MRPVDTLTVPFRSEAHYSLLSTRWQCFTSIDAFYITAFVCVNKAIAN